MRLFFFFFILISARQNLSSRDKDKLTAKYNGVPYGPSSTIEVNLGSVSINVSLTTLIATFYRTKKTLKSPYQDCQEL